METLKLTCEEIMILNIPFEELNKFRVSATTPICDAVLDYCEHYGIPVEYYGQITRPVCEFVETVW